MTRIRQNSVSCPRISLFSPERNVKAMDKDDLLQIEKAVGNLITNKIDEVSNKFDEKLIVFKEEIKEEFRHQIGIQSENFQHKLDIVVEGHDVLRKEIRDTREELCEKINLVDFKVETLNQKIDGVAADLKAHRTDTEVHKKVYKVKEE